MNPKAYQAMSSRTECDQRRSVSRMSGRKFVDTPRDTGTDNEDKALVPIRVNHSIIGLAGEVGELASLLQKWIYYGKWDGKDLDDLRLKFQDEYGDCLWYIALGLNALGIPLGAVLESNLRKLAVRYPEKYSDLLAADENRDRAKEAEAVGGNKLDPSKPAGKAEERSLTEAGLSKAALDWAKGAYPAQKVVDKPKQEDKGPAVVPGIDRATLQKQLDEAWYYLRQINEGFRRGAEPRLTPDEGKKFITWFKTLAEAVLTASPSPPYPPPSLNVQPAFYPCSCWFEKRPAVGGKPGTRWSNKYKTWVQCSDCGGTGKVATSDGPKMAKMTADWARIFNGVNVDPAEADALTKLAQEVADANLKGSDLKGVTIYSEVRPKEEPLSSPTATKVSPQEVMEAIGKVADSVVAGNDPRKYPTAGVYQAVSEPDPVIRFLNHEEARYKEEGSYPQGNGIWDDLRVKWEQWKAGKMCTKDGWKKIAVEKIQPPSPSTAVYSDPDAQPPRPETPGETKARLLRELDSCFCDDCGNQPECAACIERRKQLAEVERDLTGPERTKGYVHYASDLTLRIICGQYRSGDNSMVGRWEGVTCPKCLESRPPSVAASDDPINNFADSSSRPPRATGTGPSTWEPATSKSKCSHCGGSGVVSCEWSTATTDCPVCTCKHSFIPLHRQPPAAGQTIFPVVCEICGHRGSVQIYPSKEAIGEDVVVAKEELKEKLKEAWGKMENGGCFHIWTTVITPAGFGRKCCVCGKTEPE